MEDLGGKGGDSTDVGADDDPLCNPKSIANGLF
jgi:hypothetical protein